MMKQISDLDVANYLADHPEFFSDRDELLFKMRIPHRTKGSISLLERQISLLRERQGKSRQQLEGLIDSADRNIELFKKSKRLILDLIAAANADELFAALEKSFRREFTCKAYSLVIFSDSPGRINSYTSRVRKEVAKEQVGALIRARGPTLGALRPEENDFLFQTGGEGVHSAAVLPIEAEHGRQVGLLAIGSEDPHYFVSDMDTLFVGFISDALARLIPRYLDLPQR